MHKSGCPTRRLSLINTDSCMVTAFCVDREERGQFATHGIHQNLGSGVLLPWVDSHPRSSLVFTARCLSSSATVSSAI